MVQLKQRHSCVRMPSTCSSLCERNDGLERSQENNMARNEPFKVHCCAFGYLEFFSGCMVEYKTLKKT